MYDFGACPRCQMELDSERLQSQVIVCNHCGHTANNIQNKNDQRSQKQFIVAASGFSLLLAAAFMLVVQWDTYVLQAVPIQIKQMIGMDSAEDLATLKHICHQRKNLQCELKATLQLAKKDHEVLAELGKMQFLMGDSRSANQSFAKYFELGGLSLDASYYFARSLEQQGQVEQASQYYETVLEAKPDTLQITVTKNYIKMLMDYNKRDQAKLVLSKIRQKGSNTKDFMDPVFKELERSIQ